MDKDEFLTRVFANPFDDDQDFLAATRADPQRQQLVNELQDFDRQLRDSVRDIAMPEGLSARLKSRIHDEPVAGNPGWRMDYRWLAVAAILVVAVGLAIPSVFAPSAPSEADLAVGQRVLNHVYAETADFVGEPDVNFTRVNQVMASVGSHITDNDSTRELRFSFAKPCLIMDAENVSAHFVMQGDRGSVNVVLLNNAPVDQEFTVGDERFNGTVSPLGSGTLVLIGEKDERLEEFVRLLADNIDWVI